jgi:hypothetical protein
MNDAIELSCEGIGMNAIQQESRRCAVMNDVRIHRQAPCMWDEKCQQRGKSFSHGWIHRIIISKNGEPFLLKIGYDPHVEKTNESFFLELESADKAKHQANKPMSAKMTWRPPAARLLHPGTRTQFKLLFEECIYNVSHFLESERKKARATFCHHGGAKSAANNVGVSIFPCSTSKCWSYSTTK